MIYFEIKKCLSNISFKFIVATFFVISTVFLIMNAVNFTTEFDDPKHYDDYHRNIEQVIEDNKNRSGGSLFQIDNEFLLNDVAKQNGYYQELLDLDLSYEDTTCYRFILTNHFPLIFSLLFSIYIISYLYFKDKEGRIVDVLYSLPSYNKKHKFSKFIVVLGATLLLFIVLECIKLLLMQTMSASVAVNAPIQFVYEYIHSPYRISIVGMYFIQLSYSMLCLLGTVSILSFIASKLQRPMTFYFILFLFGLIQFGLLISIVNESIYIIFKIINIFTLTNVTSLFNKYSSFPLFSLSIEYFIGISIFMIFISVFSLVLLSLRDKPFHINKKNSNKATNSIYSLSFYEAKKVFISCRGIYLLIFVTLLQCYSILSFQPFQSEEDFYTYTFSTDLSGTISQRQDAYIEAQYMQYDDANEAMSQAYALLYSGEIDEVELDHLVYSSKEVLKSRKSFDKVVNNYQNFVAENKDEFIYEKPYLEAFANKEMYIIVLACILFPLSLLIGLLASYDKKIKIDHLTTLYDVHKKRTYKIQRNISIIMGIYLYHLIFVTQFINRLIYYQAQGFSLSVNNFISLSIPFDFSIVQCIALIYFIGFFISIVATTTMFKLARKFDNSMNSIFVLFGISALFIFAVFLI